MADKIAVFVGIGDGADPLGVYVGVKTGTLFGSSDEGETWQTIAPDLPPHLSVEAAVI